MTRSATTQPTVERAGGLVFLNPWDRIIGPNRYLVEMMRCQPILAADSLVVCDRLHEGAEEFQALGCRTAVWPEIALVRPRFDHLGGLVSHHTVGLVRLLGRLRRQRPQVLVSNTENLWLGGLLGRLLGIPHVQIFHALTVFERLTRRPVGLRLYLRVLASGAERFVAVSEHQASLLRRHGISADRLTVVPNPIPEPELDSAVDLPSGPDGLPLPREWDDGRPVLLSAGRICPLKGQDLLVEALAEVRRHHPNVICFLAGRRATPESPEDFAFQRRLDARIEALGLMDHVQFLGEVEGLGPWLRRADLYIQPSRSESFGRVVAEALLHRTPVVAFDVGAISEVAGPGGWLAPAGDTQALGRLVCDHLADPQAHSDAVEAGYQHVRTRYGADTVAESFATLLRSLG